MRVVRWKRPAVNDLVRIGKHIAADSAVNADKLLRRIQAKAEQLATYPAMGRSGLVPGTRELVVHRHYFIVYRTTVSAVEILRVKHTAQQWP
jgi:plasmid stabilization system protein ParE